MAAAQRFVPSYTHATLASIEEKLAQALHRLWETFWASISQQVQGSAATLASRLRQPHRLKPAMSGTPVTLQRH
ncbi:Hypothetical predicted protein [Pelobates cultripes]|uniref:Uncharacterized protein n=1 Tax=Pelobates cultripes TaxID=61616 RepID=A0AAD1RDR0_PELCU|nr:Hypothetical predicted protein [Pelobates cultripes]